MKTQFLNIKQVANLYGKKVKGHFKDDIGEWDQEERIVNTDLLKWIEKGSFVNITKV